MYQSGLPEIVIDVIAYEWEDGAMRYVTGLFDWVYG
jgi:hypothetical protein